MAASRNLPNLKISVENTGEDGDVKLEDVDQETEVIDENQESDVKVNINLSTFDKDFKICNLIRGTVTLHPRGSKSKFVPPAQLTPPVKRYENPQSEIFEDQDLEVIQKKLQGRASRFGLQQDESAKRCLEINDNDITILYEELKIDEKDMQNGLMRLNAIHMRGVNDMSTEDVFSYFRLFYPVSIEWINDFSCNVLWHKNEDAAKAMISLSTRIIGKEKREQKIEKAAVESKEVDDNKEVGNDDDVEIVMAVDDEDENEEGEICDDETEIEKMTGDDEPEKEQNLDNLIVPPGFWKVGVPCEKSKSVILRFATKYDKKIKGAEKISEYYKKHGNPNFKGLAGLISNSRKRKIKSAGFNDAKELFTTKLDEDKRVSSQDSDDDYCSDSKFPRQKMYADIEEERKKRVAKKKVFATAEEVESEPEMDLRSIINQRKKSSTFHQVSHHSKDDDLDDESDDNRITSSDGKKPSACSRITYRCSDSDEEQSVTSEKKMPSAFSRISYQCSDSDEDYSDREADLRSELSSSVKSDLRSRLGSASRNQHRSPLISK